MSKKETLRLLHLKLRHHHKAAPSSSHHHHLPHSASTDLLIPRPDLLRLPTNSFLEIKSSSSSSSMNLSRQIEAQRHSVERSIATSSASSPASTSAHFMSWPLPPGVDFPAPADPLLSGLKRTTSQVLDYQTVLGIHNSIGQNEAWCSSNYLAKRLRLESASNLPIYPHRPGEKDCAHYMLTRTCKFGEGCKFDHPPWVPEGGIPDWKEEISLELRVDPFWFTTDFSERHLATRLNRWTSVSLSTTSEPLPERLGEPDCPYFLKTQRCKYGSKCKFNHPKDNLGLGASENTDVSLLPDRPSEPSCAFYMKTGKCKFGTTCKFHHPKDIWIPLIGQENGKGGEIESAVMMDETTGERPVLLQNSKGLPIRPGEVDCPFYMKTGSCKYGASCRYNHPDRNAINPPAAAIGHPILAPTVAHVNLGVVGSAVSLYQNIDPGLTQPLLGVGTTIYPQRPGQTACDYYMKTGECKFGERCKFHHPIDRSASTAMQAQQTLKLTLAGLPRREGVVHCPYYMKTGTCKYGATCKFDHPPPGEVLATTGSQRASASVGLEIDGA